MGPLTVSALATLIAPALAADRLGGHQIDAGLVTDFPVLVGADAVYEHPSRLRGGVRIGVMPQPYLDTINWAMTTYEVYSDGVATLIDVALQGSLITRFELGYRPFEERGFFFAAGYQLIGLGGDATDVEEMASSMDGGLGDFAAGANGQLNIRVAAHEVAGETGWEWVIKERLVLRTSLNFAYTFHTKTTITGESSPGPLGDVVVDEVALAGEDYLDFIFEEWVHLPSITLGAAWRFR